MEEKKVKLTITYKLIEIKKLSYFENEYSKFGLTKKDMNRAKFEIRTGIKFIEEDEILNFLLKIICSHPNIDDYQYYGIETSYRFKIKSLNKYKDPKLQGFQIPDNVMHNFFNIAFSGTRGMINVLNNNPVYQNMILPITDPSLILNQMKAKKSKE